MYRRVQRSGVLSAGCSGRIQTLSEHNPYQQDYRGAKNIVSNHKLFTEAWCRLTGREQGGEKTVSSTVIKTEFLSLSGTDGRFMPHLSTERTHLGLLKVTFPVMHLIFSGPAGRREGCL